MPNIPYKKIALDMASPNPPKAKILLIYTGGTFGMERNSEGNLVPFNFSQVLLNIPVIQSFDLHITVIAFEKPIDSSDMSPEHWSKLTGIILEENLRQDGFVILHGTDTMAFTASALSFALVGLNKPVIITGAQLPVSQPRTDARENLITSLEIAAAKHVDRTPKVPEVCVFFNHHLLRGNRAQKVQSSKFDAFTSENYPALAEAGIEIAYNQNAILSAKASKNTLSPPPWFTGVTVLKIFPGITKAAVDAVLTNPNLKGIVLETFGAGNAMSAKWFINSLKEAIERKVIIINVSQCLGGYVHQGMYASSSALANIGVVSGSDITVEAALTKLMYVLGKGQSYNSAINDMLTPICGELG